MAPRVGLLALLVLVAGVAVGAAAPPTASITAADAQPIPEQRLTIEGATFTPASVSVHDPGDTLSLDIAVSNDSLYRVAIYNTDEQIVTQERRSTDASLAFDLDSYPAGTYMVAVVQNGSYLALHPLLVRGYAVSVDSPSEAPADGTVTVDATVDRLRGESLGYVEVVVTDGDQRVRTRATGSDGEYSASVDVSPLKPGSYDVYATVRGSTDAYGETEFLGVNEAVTLDLQASTPTPGSGGGGDGSGGGGDTGGTSTPTATTTGTATPTPTGTPTATSGPTTTSTVTDTPTSTETDATPTPTVTSTATDDGVVTPASTTPTPQADQPGFGVLAAVLACALAALLAGRRT